eukprot:gene25719-11376_t
MNKILKCVLSDVHHVICVSHTSKENTVLRACLPPDRVSVIPNAVHTADFQPMMPSDRPGPSDSLMKDTSTSSRLVTRSQSQRDELSSNSARLAEVVALSRLVYRKGIDLLALAIPLICARHAHVNFLIGGDGPKRKLLEAMICEHKLEGRVQLAGAVAHEQVRDFLLRGQVFVNSSLTEAFCMAIVEAASAGLMVVSTHVGGVPEEAFCMAIVEAASAGLMVVSTHVGGVPEEAFCMAIVEAASAGLMVVSTHVGGVPEEAFCMAIVEAASAGLMVVSTHVGGVPEEAFCMAIVEAASAGLMVVSTHVGGVPEEAFCMAIVEAASAGLMVVSTHVGGVPEEAFYMAIVEAASAGLMVVSTHVGGVPEEAFCMAIVEAASAGLMVVSTHVGGVPEEAFCMAIVEAASAGLMVVSTHVGGVPEVLPSSMTVMAEPSVHGLCQGLDEAIRRAVHQQHVQQYARVRDMYSWQDVGQRTCNVYNLVSVSKRDDSALARVRRYLACGTWSGGAFAAIAVMSYWYLWLLSFWQPISSIDVALDWPHPPAT